jgi:hypothetical protein
MAHNTIWEEKGLFWQFSGEVTALEVQEANNELYSDPRFDTAEYFIWDMTDVSEVCLTESDVGHAVAMDRGASFTNNRLNGALIANNEHIRNLITQYIDASAVSGNPWKLKLFNNLEEARSWLSLDIKRFMRQGSTTR